MTRLFVGLSREDGAPDNTLVRTIGVVAAQGFQIQDASLYEFAGRATVKMQVAFKGKLEDEYLARLRVMHLLGISSLHDKVEVAIA